MTNATLASQSLKLLLLLLLLLLFADENTYKRISARSCKEFQLATGFKNARAFCSHIISPSRACATRGLG